jgi:hypothetical protein
MYEKTSCAVAGTELDGFKPCVGTVSASQDEQDWNLPCAWNHLLQPNQALRSLQVAARLFEGWWKDAKEMMFILKNRKIVVSVFLIACVFNNQVFAQVKTGLMKCNDIRRNINFSVHFKGSEVLLLLKGYTYRVPYARSHVSAEGERWSTYENREIAVDTTAPYDKYVSIASMPSGAHIASTYCE